MKKFAPKSQLALAVVVALGLSACNQAADDGSQTPAQDSVIEKTTSGVITGFGSVFVNGVEYETDGARFVVDGVEGDESLLKLGMVVTLSGSASTDGTGQAVNIEFEDEVEGEVLANNILTDGTLNVMGLIVHVNEDTVFESQAAEVANLEGILQGNIVEVSGYSAGDGTVWATRIEVKKMVHEKGEEIEVKGIIGNLTATQFVIGDLTVDYTNASLDADITDGLQDGMLVEVKSEEGRDANGVLLASKIELKNANGRKQLRYDSDDEKVELEGVITAITSNTEIDVNGAPVVLDANTRFIHGNINTLTVGLKIKVVGVVNADEKLLAEKLVYKPTGDVKLEGQVTQIDLTNNTFVMYGRTITVDNYTMVKDEKDEAGQVPVKYNFGVDDLVEGDWLKIKAYENADGGLTAIKLKRENAEADQRGKISGIIDAIDPAILQLTISGITVDYSGYTDFTAQVGDKVEMKGELVNGVFVPSQKLELDEKDDDMPYIGGSDGHEDDEAEMDNDDESDSNHEGNSDSDNEASDEGNHAGDAGMQMGSDADETSSDDSDDAENEAEDADSTTENTDSSSES